jgi:hypothetical protein
MAQEKIWGIVADCILQHGQIDAKGQKGANCAIDKGISQNEKV